MKKYSKALFGLTFALVATTASADFDGIAVKVNNDIILKSELNNAINRLRVSQPSTTTEAIYSQALGGLITKKLQQDIIKKSGIKANEQMVNQELVRIAQAQGHKSLPAFAEALEKQQAGSFFKLREQVADEIAIAALWQHEIGNRVKISKEQVKEFLASPQGQALKPDEYRTIHVRIPYLDDYNRLSDTQKNQAMAVAQRLKRSLEQGVSLQAAMQSAKGDYPRPLQGADTGYNRASALPANIVLEISKLAVGQATDPVITDHGIDVVLLADKRTSGQIIDPQWHTSHILVKIDNAQSEPAARQKIGELYKALQQGEDFSALATRHSDDTGSAVNGGDLGWVQSGVMVPEFQTVMQNTAKDDFSAPFATQFGYHILKVNDIKERDVTNDYLYTQAQEALFQKLAPQALEDWIQEMRAAAYIEMVK